MSFLHQRIFEMKFLLFEAMDEIDIGEGSVFLALHFLFQFGMFHAERGHMVVVHLILLIVRLDDLTAQVNHESKRLSPPKMDQIGDMGCTAIFWR
jgi:hypothetical protein